MKTEELFGFYRKSFLEPIDDYQRPDEGIPEDRDSSYVNLVKVAHRLGVTFIEFVTPDGFFNGGRGFYVPGRCTFSGVGEIVIHSPNTSILSHELCHAIDFNLHGEPHPLLERHIGELVACAASWIAMSRVFKKKIGFWSNITYPKNCGARIHHVDRYRHRILSTQAKLVRIYNEVKKEF